MLRMLLTYIIARYGKTVVKMMAHQKRFVSERIGIARGKLKTPANLDQDNEAIAALFGVDE